MRKLIMELFTVKDPPSKGVDGVLTVKYVNSGLTLKEASGIKRKVRHALEQDRIYKNNTIDLNTLSQYIQEDRYKVSQVINEYLSKNFYALINQYRIEEAKDLLLNQPIISVKAVMYEVGFNSKTSFYCAFKKETGQSPNDFRNLTSFAS